MRSKGKRMLRYGTVKERLIRIGEICIQGKPWQYYMMKHDECIAVVALLISIRALGSKHTLLIKLVKWIYIWGDKYSDQLSGGTCNINRNWN